MGNIVITGANRGIGLALVKRFADAGHHVLALCRSPENASELKTLAQTGRVTLGLIDIADENSIMAAAKMAEGQVDVLINNAGIVGDENPSFDGVDVDDWMNAFKVMTIGPFLVTRAFLPKLVEAKGKVVVTSSQLAASTWPYGGYYSYSTAKAAGNRMVQSLARDLADRGVTIVSLHPGWVQTDMGGAEAEITPAESADGIFTLVDKLRPDQSGGFFKWNGEPHPL
jgi:NAD(P)-dependent dehydrogenase (short-subunit alcohol dehydrogenase family)